MAETDTKFKTPKSEEELAASKSALDKLLAKFGGSKNELSRSTGFSRNSVSFWFSKGYMGRRAAETLVGKGYKLEELRPDLFI